MAAAQSDLEIEKGTTFKYSLAYLNSDDTPILLNGFTAKMQIRTKHASAATLAEYTTENGIITISPAEGKISIKVPATETNSYTWVDGVYDLVIISPQGEVTRLLMGTISVSPNVTKIT